MSAEHYKRARELFAEALEKADTAERAAWLAQACGDDVQLRQSVEALLWAYEKAGAFLEQPAGAPGNGDVAGPGQTLRVSVALTEKPGDKIGPYKLLQQIGEGGCGVVYMAEQTEPIRRKVARKSVLRGEAMKSLVYER